MIDVKRASWSRSFLYPTQRLLHSRDSSWTWRMNEKEHHPTSCAVVHPVKDLGSKPGRLQSRGDTLLYQRDRCDDQNNLISLSSIQHRYNVTLRS